MRSGRGFSQVVALLFLMLFSVTAAHAAVTVPENPAHAWQAPLARRSLLLAIDKTSDTLYVVGERGHILRRQKNISEWEQAQVPTQVLLTAITMQNEQNGWAVGHDAVILETSDGGVSWSKRFEAPEEEKPLMDVRFRDADHGIAIGAYGYYLHTSDHGKTWQARLINEEHDFHLNALSDRLEGNLYIAAEFGYVYRSSDQGKTWATLNPPYEGSFFDVVSLGGGTVVVVGLRGHAFVSHDSGDTWEPMETGTEVSLNSVIQLENGRILIAGHAGMLLLSDPKLEKLYPYRFADRKALSDMLETTGNRIEIVGEAGVKSVDLCLLYDRDQLSGCP